jgi:subtilase family serine protease
MPNPILSPAKCLVVLALFFSLGALRLSAQVSAAPPRITQAVNDSKLVVLPGNVHPLARPQYDRGLAPASLPMDHMLLVLKRGPQQEAALGALLAEQQDRNSPNYHKWLTPDEFGSEFGPSGQDIQTIESWLESQGFTVNSVSAGRTVIDFSGTAATVQSAFHTAMHRYVLPDGKQHWANSTNPEIPAALASVVVGVRSLNNFFPKPHHHAAVRPAFTYPYGAPCNPSSDDCFDVTPADFDKIYNVPVTATGSGVTIAIVSDTDVAPTDLQQFRSIFGLPAMTINGPSSSAPTCTLGVPCFTQFVPPGQTDPGIQCPVPGEPYSPSSCTNSSVGTEVEAALDLEWAGAPAPAANLWLVASADTNTSFGGDLSANYIVNCPATGTNCPVAVPASVLSSSYGDCEFILGTSGNQFYDALWQQAAAEGITVVVAAGDSGSAGCDYYDPSYPTPQPAEDGLQVDGTASTPYDVAVGGTDFDEASNPLNYWSLNNSATGASAMGYIPETTWNDSCTNTIFGSSAIANCNNANLDGQGTNDGYYIWTLGASGGKSSCTVSNFNTITYTGSLSSCSTAYPKPSWQTGTGVPADGVRDIPDISLFASNGFLGSAYITCEADTPAQVGAPGQAGTSCSLNGQTPNANLSTASFVEVGGTSASVQAFAGIVALLDQQAGDRQGNLNPLLYSLAAQSGNTCASVANPASTCVFYDVSSGTISQPCDYSLHLYMNSPSPNCTTSGSDQVGLLETNGQLAYNAATGYDLATGLGSVNVGNLIGKWPTTGNFILSSANPFVTIPSSTGSGSLSISITSENGFSGSIDFSSSSCSGLPSGFSCTFPTSTTLAAGATVTATVTVKPSGTGMLVPSKAPGPWTRNRLAIVLPLSCVFGLAILALTSVRRLRFRWAALALVFIGFVAVAGCGGGGSANNGGGGGGGGGGGTTTTTATMTVTAGGQSHTMNFQVTVE